RPRLALPVRPLRSPTSPGVRAPPLLPPCPPGRSGPPPPRPGGFPEEGPGGPGPPGPGGGGDGGGGPGRRSLGRERAPVSERSRYGRGRNIDPDAATLSGEAAQQAVHANRAGAAGGVPFEVFTKAPSPDGSLRTQPTYYD